MDHFAGRLKELRLAKGLTQDGLAKIAGVPVATVKRLEQGTRQPMLETASKLARALGVTAAAFEPAAKK
jgi:transcriptional regulator with XRE-family HTH domain